MLQKAVSKGLRDSNDSTGFNTKVGDAFFDGILREMDSRIGSIQAVTIEINKRIESLIGVDYRESLVNESEGPIEDNSNLYGALCLLNRALCKLDTKLENMNSHLSRFV